MHVTDYQTTAQMAETHPSLRVAAVRFRLARFINGDTAAREAVGEDAACLIDHWHGLQKQEA